MCPCRYAVRNKTGNRKKKKIVRNKAIPSRAREPVALSIYAPLRRFQKKKKKKKKTLIRAKNSSADFTN